MTKQSMEPAHLVCLPQGSSKKTGIPFPTVYPDMYKGPNLQYIQRIRIILLISKC